MKQRSLREQLAESYRHVNKVLQAEKLIAEIRDLEDQIVKLDSSLVKLKRFDQVDVARFTCRGVFIKMQMDSRYRLLRKILPNLKQIDIRELEGADPQDVAQMLREFAARLDDERNA